MSDNKAPLISQEVKNNENSKKSCTFDVWPYVNRRYQTVSWTVVVLMVLAVYAWRTYLVKLATKNGLFLYVHWYVGITSIAKFMFSFLKEKKMLSVKGEMWRETLFYVYLIFCSLMGLLNSIIPIMNALDRKPLIPGFYSYKFGLLVT